MAVYNIKGGPANCGYEMYLGEHVLYGSARLGTATYKNLYLGYTGNALAYPKTSGFYVCYVDRDEVNLPLQPVDGNITRTPGGKLEAVASVNLALEGIGDTPRPVTGIRNVTVVNLPVTLTPPVKLPTVFNPGTKRYEFSNHLGNVLATVSDMPLGVDADHNGLAGHYMPDVKSVSDYEPFGAPLAERTFAESGDKYRFGFNGKESIDEVYGEGNAYDFGARAYDPRIGRWLSVDPLGNQFPWQSPYVGFDNSPIALNDPSGMSSDNPNGDPPTEKKSINVAFFPKKLQDHNGAIPNMYENASQDGGENLIVRQIGNIKDMTKELKTLGEQYNIENVFIVGHGSEKGSEQIGDEWVNASQLNNNKTLLKELGSYLNQNGVRSRIIMINCHAGKTNFISAFADLTQTTVLGNQSWSMARGAFTGNPIFGVVPDASYSSRPDPIDKSGKWSVAFPKGQVPVFMKDRFPSVNGNSNVLTIPAITINSNGTIGVSSQEDLNRIESLRNTMKQKPTLKFSQIGL